MSRHQFVSLPFSLHALAWRFRGAYMQKKFEEENIFEAL